MTKVRMYVSGGGAASTVGLYGEYKGMILRMLFFGQNNATLQYHGESMACASAVDFFPGAQFEHKKWYQNQSQDVYLLRK